MKQSASIASASSRASTLSLLLLAGSLSAQAQLNWVLCPVNGHYYARLDPMNFQAAKNTANALGVHLATIRNAAENQWILNNMLVAGGGLEPWIGVEGCTNAWMTGLPRTYQPAGSYPTGCCGNGGSPNASCIIPSGAHAHACQSDVRYGVLEMETNLPYTWASDARTSPSARRGAVAAFDGARNSTILFGGLDTAFRNDTWAWDPSNGWTVRFTFFAPPARSDASMVFDSARNKIVLFGGRGAAGLLADTWLWDGVAWTEVVTTGGPSARAQSSMAFDSRRGVVVMHGGETGATTSDNETWEFNGAAWVRVTTPTLPAARFGHGMFFDTLRGRTVMFGGRVAAAASSQTWVYDGVDWTLQSLVDAPDARFRMGAAWDPARLRGVVMGGTTDGTTNLDDTWAYTGNLWIRLHTATRPTARREHVLVQHRDQLLVAGGWTNTLLWGAFTGKSTPSQVPYGSGCNSITLTAPNPTSAVPAIGGTAGVRVNGLAANAPCFMMIGLSRTSVGSTPLPIPLDGLGMPGCWLLQDIGLEFSAFCPSSGAATAQFNLPIPNLPGILGYHLYLQSWAFQQASNSAGLVLSHGMDLTIGGL